MLESTYKARQENHQAHCNTSEKQPAPGAPGEDLHKPGWGTGKVARKQQDTAHVLVSLWKSLSLSLATKELK